MNLNPSKDPTGKLRHVRVRRSLGPDLIGLELEFAVKYNSTQPDSQPNLGWMLAGQGSWHV